MPSDATAAANLSTISAAVIIAKAGGGINNPDELTKAVATVSKPSEDLFASFIDYQRDAILTAISIKELSDLTDVALSVDEKQLKVLKDLLDVNKAAYDADMLRLDKVLEKAQADIDAVNGVTVAVMSVESAIANLSTAINGLAAAQAAQAGTRQTYSGTGSPSYNMNATAGYIASSGYASVAAAQGDMDNALLSTYQAGGDIWLAAAAMGMGGDFAVGHFRDAGIPGFATGGAHVGGWRIVGENGPELERTGPSHIFSNSQSKSLVDNSELIAEIKALREEVKAGQEAIAMNTRQTTKILRDVTQDGTSITTSVAA